MFSVFVGQSYFSKDASFAKPGAYQLRIGLKESDWLSWFEMEFLSTKWKMNQSYILEDIVKTSWEQKMGKDTFIQAQCT